MRPPNTIADCGLFNPMKRATSGVPIMTRIDFTSPAATLRVIIASEAPMASPVTGPTM